MRERMYTLDGIPTRFVAHGQSVDGIALADRIECACGWVAPSLDVFGTCDEAALRFHYTNCEHARGDTLAAHIEELEREKAELLAFVRGLVVENDTEEWLDEDNWGPDYGDKPDEAYRGGKSDQANITSQKARAAIASAKALTGETK